MTRQIMSKMWIDFSENRSDFTVLNFLNFRSDTIEKQGIRNFSSFVWRYVSVVLGDFEVTFLREG